MILWAQCHCSPSFLIQVLFSRGEKGVLSRNNFEWNKNDFCQLFRHTKNAQEFIDVWHEHTTFNKITQSAEPCTSDADHDESPQQSSDDPGLFTPQSPAPKRPAEESASQVPAKKPCTNTTRSNSPLDVSIEMKKTGMCLKNTIVITEYV